VWGFWILGLLGPSFPGTPIHPGRARAAEPQAATPAAKAIAKKAYEQGTAHYKKAEWDLAIEQFEICQQNFPQPVFLYNIAQAHNKAGRPKPALEYYKKYLEAAPTAQNRADVEQIITELSAQVEPPKPPPPEVKTFPEAPAVEPPPQNQPPPKSGGLSKKTWYIIAGAAGGAVLVGTAIGLGVYFGTRAPAPTVFQPVNP